MALPLIKDTSSVPLQKQRYSACLGLTARQFIFWAGEEESEGRWWGGGRVREGEKKPLWHAARPLPVQTEGLLRAPAGRPLRNCFLWVRKTTKKGKLLVSGNTRQRREVGGKRGWRRSGAFEGGEGVGLGGGQRQNKWMEMCLLKGRFSVRQQEETSVRLKSHLTLGNWALASLWCLPLLARVTKTGLEHCVIVHLFIFHHSKLSVPQQR